MNAVAKARNLFRIPGIDRRQSLGIAVDGVNIDIGRNEKYIFFFTVAVFCNHSFHDAMLIAAVLPTLQAALIIGSKGILGSGRRRDKEKSDFCIGAHGVKLSDKYV